MADDFQTLFDKGEGVSKSAAISECGRYRWTLHRRWQYSQDRRVLCFVMLNPSTADGTDDDPTVRRCMGFAQAWGFGILSIRNLFPFRATDPRELLTAHDPTGGHRGNAELRAAMTADTVVVAWGAKVPFGRDREAMAILSGTPLYCLGRTKAGHPRHPLYVRKDRELELFK
jgi:hypothetical protein